MIPAAERSGPNLDIRPDRTLMPSSLAVSGPTSPKFGPGWLYNATSDRPDATLGTKFNNDSDGLLTSRTLTWT